MTDDRTGQTAVIFVSERLPDDPQGYAEAADAMAALAAAQPGYRSADAVRDGDGVGITVSYWADEASAIAWRQHPDHAEIRERGRGRWYRWYRLHVAQIGRSYGWERG
jgi:heme-degrading monooxygenase HmoA